MANFSFPFRIHLCVLLCKQLNNLEFHKQTKIQTDRHLALFKTRQFRTGQHGSGQVCTGQYRLYETPSYPLIYLGLIPIVFVIVP